MKNYQIIAIPPHRIDHVKSAKTCKRIFCGSQKPKLNKNFLFYDFFICFGFRRNLSTERTLKYQLVWQNTIKRVLAFLYLPLRRFVIYLWERKIFLEKIFLRICIFFDFELPILLWICFDLAYFLIYFNTSSFDECRWLTIIDTFEVVLRVNFFSMCHRFHIW